MLSLPVPPCEDVAWFPINVTHVFGPGKLQSVDGYMNIALDDCNEWAEGKQVHEYGEAFVRGNNGKRLLFSLIATCLTKC
jgi:hypothetical protein